jgi:DNA uptake protein ComE-like DNA-binding protein
MWKDWMSYSKAERNGIVILFFFVCLSAFFPYIYQTFYFKESPLADSNTFYRVDSFFNSLNYIPPKSNQNFSYTAEESPKTKEPELFNFDPNTITTSELVRLGFSARQAAVIENFRNKGGLFKKPKDFGKMYVVDSTMYRKLEPFINIDNKSQVAAADSAESKSYKPFVPEVLYLELNSVDTLQLQKLRGIGKGFARRIVAYRQLLGGFHSTNQLAEIYGFPKDLIEVINPQVWVDTIAVKKIDLNLVTYQDLRKHPYLSDYQSRAIIFYREKMGNFQTIDQVIKNKLVDKETYKKLKPYLTVN